MPMRAPRGNAAEARCHVAALVAMAVKRLDAWRAWSGGHGWVKTHATTACTQCSRIILLADYEALDEQCSSQETHGMVRNYSRASDLHHCSRRPSDGSAQG